MRIFLAGLVLLGCAAAESRAPELSPWRSPAGQRCMVTGGGFPLAAVLDSVAVADRLVALDSADGAVLLSFSIDSTGATKRFRRIEATLPDPAAAAVEAAIEPFLRTTEPKARYGRLLVEVRDGDVSRMEVGPAESCRPVLTNESQVRRALMETARWHLTRGDARVWLFVDSTGTVTKGQVREGTGVFDFDAAMLAAARQGRFHPAIMDREPVGVWVAINLSLREPCRPSEAGVPSRRGCP